MTFLTTLFAATLALPLPAVNDGDAPEVIRLKVGTEVVGTVTSDGFDEAKGVRIRRVDDDALLDIGFDQMLPEDALRIRAAHGYLPDEPEALMVEASRIKLATGQELICVIVERGVKTIKVRTGAQVVDLDASGVREITPVRVDALEVYDPDELYAQEVAKRNPISALDHYNLALYCESLQLWKSATAELEQVQSQDSTFKPELVKAKLERAKMRVEAAEDSALLAKAHRLAVRDQYDAALAVLDDFLVAKPGSILRADFEKTRRAIVKQRDKWVRTQVVVNFFTFMERVARELATDKGGSIKAARKQIELEGTKRGLELTAKFLKIRTEEVTAAWEDDKRNLASAHSATYGSGTWTLGSIEAVTKGMKKAEDPNKKGDANAAAAKKGEQTLEDKIKELIEKKKKEAADAQAKAKQNQGKGKGGAKGPQQPRDQEIADVPPTEDEWWNLVTVDERVQYLLAWWVDREPHAKIFVVDHRDCPNCAATGVIKYFDAKSGEDKMIPCPRCKGAQVDRVLRYH
jgi:hypothetical protein